MFFFLIVTLTHFCLLSIKNFVSDQLANKLLQFLVHSEFLETVIICAKQSELFSQRSDIKARGYVQFFNFFMRLLFKKKKKNANMYKNKARISLEGGS